MGKFEEKTLAIRRYKWENSFQMYFKQIGWDGTHELDPSGSGQEPVTGSCEQDS